MKTDKPLKIAMFVLIAVSLFLLARDLVDGNLERFPPETVYLQFVSPDGGSIARFSVKYQSICRWLSDIEPHCYLTVTNLENGQLEHRSNRFESPNLRANFLALAKAHTTWCVEAIEKNPGPYLVIQHQPNPNQRVD